MRYYIDFFKARDELSGFNLWLKKLKSDSIDRYKSRVLENENYFQILEDVNHIGNVSNYIRDFVYGLIELGYIDGGEIGVILSKIQQITAIEPIRIEDSGVFGICTGNVLYINPEIKGSETLSIEERIRLYVCKELTKFLYDHWQEDVDLYLDDVISCRKKSGDYSGTFFVRSGFDLLKDVVAQDVAENIAYLFAKKSRPEKKVCSDEMLYGGDFYRTNLDYCGAVEDVIVDFSKTINTVANGTFGERENLLKQLACNGFNEDFISSVICQFDNSLEEKHDFYDMFLSMGKIYSAYRTRETGVGDSDELYFSGCYKASLTNLCNKYSDIRAKKEKTKSLVLVTVAEDIE